MKLLLDEMLPATIAEQLRRRGHDVVAVSERPELRGLPDPELFEHSALELRAIVTYSRDDYLELDRHYRAAERNHNGVIILNPRNFPHKGRPRSVRSSARSRHSSARNHRTQASSTG